MKRGLAIILILLHYPLSGIADNVILVGFDGVRPQDWLFENDFTEKDFPFLVGTKEESKFTAYPSGLSLPAYTGIFAGKPVPGCVDNENCTGAPDDSFLLDAAVRYEWKPDDAAVFAAWAPIATAVGRDRLVDSVFVHVGLEVLKTGLLNAKFATALTREASEFRKLVETIAKKCDLV